MALNALGMKEAIIDALGGKTDSAVNANRKFGDAVLGYICDNTEITYGWAAQTSGTSDPQVVIKPSVSGSGVLGPSNSLGEMLGKLATLIKGLTISSPGFMVPFAFNPGGVLSVEMHEETSQDEAMESFCKQVVHSLQGSFVNPASIPGSHGSYTGATTGMVIV